MRRMNTRFHQGKSLVSEKDVLSDNLNEKEQEDADETVELLFDRGSCDTGTGRSAGDGV
jgi:hypothetical protein